MRSDESGFEADQSKTEAGPEADEAEEKESRS